MRYAIFALLLVGSVFSFYYVNAITEEWFKAETKADTTQSLPSSSDERVQYWQQRIAEVGGKAAYQHFKADAATVRQNEQHDQAHLFGEALYRALGIPGVAVCDQDFAFGCYHSFFGYALLENGVEVITALDEACTQAFGLNVNLGCQHGIGHGLLIELGYDRFNEALEKCATLTWKEPIGGCTSGVFMEYNFHTMAENRERPVDERGWHYPCTNVADRFLQACYFEMPAWWSALTDSDFNTIGERCEEAPNKDARRACYQGSGNVVGGILDSTISEIALACEEMPNSSAVYHCIEGSIWILQSKEPNPRVWLPLCDVVDVTYQQQCIAYAKKS